MPWKTLLRGLRQAATLMVAGSLALSSRPGLAAPPASGDGRRTPAVTLTADGVTLDWRTPPAEVSAAGQVTLPGYAQQAEPGRPTLPMATAQVALPPGATPTLEVLQVEDEALPAWPGFQKPASAGQGAAPVQLAVLGTVRGVRLAQVSFRPVGLGSGGWRLVRHVRAVVKFNAALPAATAAAAPLDPLLTVVQRGVVNPDLVRAAAAAILPSGPRVTARTASSGAEAAIEVSATGLTAITYEALVAAGFPAAQTDPHNLHLTRAGQEIALQWEGDDDTTFEAGERLLFYAAPRFSRWTTADVYFLSAGATPGLRMASRAAAPGSLPAGAPAVDKLAEVNAKYMPYCYCGPLPLGRDGDRWAWDTLFLGGPTSGTYTTSLAAVDTSRPATLTVWLISYTAIASAPVDHRVSVNLNGTALGEAEWKGVQAITATFALPAGLLLEAKNTLQVSLPGISGVTVEGIWFDAFSIHYARNTAAAGPSALFAGQADTAHAYTIGLDSVANPRAYDVTAEDQPVALSGLQAGGTTVSLGDSATPQPRRYWVTADSGLLSPARVRLTVPLTGATGTYIIISPPAFTPALAALVAQRQAQGLSVVTEDPQAIYDAYGDGRPIPDALRAYIQNAYQTWQPQPLPVYVLLVGDGTLDPKRYGAKSTVTFIPPYLAEVDPLAGETASDNQYVTVDGADNLPDLLIGRLPVNTLAEAQTVAGKIVHYETQPAPSNWNRYAAFIAGDSDPATAVDFVDQSETGARAVPAPFVPLRLYYTPATWVPSLPSDYKAAVMARWNKGAGLMVYTGHASNQQWMDQRLFHYDDVASLWNAGRLPVLLEMTCFTGMFHIPDLQTLDEALLRRPTGGAVAVWGPTGLGYASDHQFLAEGFIQAVYQPGTTLGAAALAGKQHLVTAFELRDTYNLLGDPALQFNRTIGPEVDTAYLPLVRR